MENSRNGIILHDYFGIRGGGERLIGILSHHMGWPVLTGFKSEWCSKQVSDGRGEDGFQSIEKASTLNCRQGLLPLQIMSLIRGFRDRSGPYLKNFDAVLYSGTYAPLGVINSPASANSYYCHSPPRFVYDQRAFYLSAIPYWQRPVLNFLIKQLQPLYETAMPLMDKIIANSENVKNRIRYFLNLDSIVIHPPCDTERFRWRGQDNFFLSTARLDPLKRVDLIVEAFKKMPESNLIVVSGGPEIKKLQKSAADAENIKILGWVPEDRLRALIGSCIATIYIPRDEDFGMSPVESLAAGKPVIGVQEGGLMETIGDGDPALIKCRETNMRKGHFTETPYGLLVKRDPQARDIIEAVQRMNAKRAVKMKKACEMRATAFGTNIFMEKMRAVLS